MYEYQQDYTPKHIEDVCVGDVLRSNVTALIPSVVYCVARIIERRDGSIVTVSETGHPRGFRAGMLAYVPKLSGAELEAELADGRRRERGEVA